MWCGELLGLQGGYHGGGVCALLSAFQACESRRLFLYFESRKELRPRSALADSFVLLEPSYTHLRVTLTYRVVQPDPAPNVPGAACGSRRTTSKPRP